MLAILGGAKVGSKIAVIKNLMKQVDKLVIGGGMAYTFLKVQGLEIGDSLFDEESADIAREILEEAKKAGIELLLPVDCVVADKFDNDANHKVVSVEAISPAGQGVDFGPRSVELVSAEVIKAQTVV